MEPGTNPEASRSQGRSEAQAGTPTPPCSPGPTSSPEKAHASSWAMGVERLSLSSPPRSERSDDPPKVDLVPMPPIL